MIYLIIIFLLYKSINAQTSIGYIYNTAGGGSGTNSGFFGDNGKATSASLNTPFGVVVDKSGNIYIADSLNYRVRKVTISTGIITTIGGTGFSSYSGDNGQATSANMYPYGIAVDTSANVYFADVLNQRIRKITVSTGIVTTVAGAGVAGYSSDNIAATSSNIYSPQGVTVDSSGNIYIADTGNDRIRKVTSGIIKTVAGNGAYLYNGDNQQATSATLNNPTGVEVDSSGNIYIADQFNHRIRKVTVSTGIITTIAGTGSNGYTGNNIAATSCKLNYPQDVAVDASGNVYVADSDNDLLRKITSGIITTLAGTYGYYGYYGDNGLATSSTLNGPQSVCLDSFGNIYIADTYNYRIRKIVTSTGVYTTTPTAIPTRVPTAIPTAIPTRMPTIIPTALPTRIPTTVPTAIPPTITPTALPSTSLPTKSPTSLPTVLPSYVPSFSPTVSPTCTPTYRPTVLPSYVPSVSPTVSPTCTPTYKPTVLPSYVPSVSPTVLPTLTPTITPSVTPSSVPSVTPSSVPSMAPSVTPSSVPSVNPSSVPSMAPSSLPSVTPSSVPSVTPSSVPSITPSVTPSSVPSMTPTSLPTTTPTIAPSKPTYAPTFKPTYEPSSEPTGQPSRQPSSRPSSQPSAQPSSKPTSLPSTKPTSRPSAQPSGKPTSLPSTKPTSQPSSQPSSKPTSLPSTKPTSQPSSQPSREPSSQPSRQPSSKPSSQPSSQPSSKPTTQPSSKPSSPPSAQPTAKPSTSHPSCSPTYKPTPGPTSQPSSQPSSRPTGEPTSQPSNQPTVQPSSMPTSQPSSRPSTQPSSKPSRRPTSQPSAKPTSKPSTSHPSCSPTYKPTAAPTSQPTGRPSSRPSTQPSRQPSTLPTSQPSSQPSDSPSGSPSTKPSSRPTNLPSSSPSSDPSSEPSSIPSARPSATPSCVPSSQPTSAPSSPSSLPSSFPSSPPTSQPSADHQKKINSILALDTSAIALRNKLKYYLASFIAYFVFLYLLLWLLDKSKLGKSTSDALHLSAFNSKRYLSTGAIERQNFVNALPVKNKLVKLLRQDKYIASQSDETSGNSNRSKETGQGLSAQENPMDIESEVSDGGGYASSDSRDGAGDSEVVFTDAFYHYILQKRCLIGCTGLLYPKGYKLNLLFTSLDLPVGVYEDFLVHLYNNHSLFSCIYSVKGSPISRNACRIVYIVQNCIAFFIFSFTNMIYDFIGLNSNFSVLSDILITSPLSLFFGSIALGLYTCPIVNSIEFEQSSLSRYKKSIMSMGRFMVLPFIALVFGLLLLSALCTRRSNIFYVIISFIWQAQLQAFVLELLYAVLLFKSTYYYQVKLAGFTLIEVGCLFAERVLKSTQQEYYMYYSRHLHGLFVRDYITITKAARLQELATESRRLVSVGVEECNRISVMSPTSNSSNNNDDVEVFENPLLAMKKAPRLSMVKSDVAAAAHYPTASLDNYDPENEFNETNTLRKNIFQTVTLNPMLGASNAPLKKVEHYATQRKSDIQLGDLHGSRVEFDSNNAEEEGLGSDDDELEDTFDDMITIDSVPKASSNEPHKRGTAYVGYETAYQKPKVVSTNPLQTKIAHLKDGKHEIKKTVIAEDEEDDDALYEEFQVFRIDLNRRSEVGLSSEGDEISFEDWKINRKNLRAKEESYVNAFRFFERREQETGTKAPKLTPSQQRAMGLHVKFGKRASLLRQDDSTKETKPETTSETSNQSNTRSI